MAESINVAGQALVSYGGGKWPIKSWLELINPKHTQKDDRSSDQILDDLMSKLL